MKKPKLLSLAAPANANLEKILNEPAVSLICDHSVVFTARCHRKPRAAHSGGLQCRTWDSWLVLITLSLVAVVGDAAGDVGVFVEVVAGADAMVAIRDVQWASVDEVSADQQDWG